MLFVQVPATDRNALNSLWGKLASEILMQNWEAAMEDLTRLRETIDNNVMPHHSEFNTALGFPYIGCDIDCLLFQQSTTTTTAAVSLSLSPSLSFFLSFPTTLFCLQFQKNLNYAVLLLIFNCNDG